MAAPDAPPPAPAAPPPGPALAGGSRKISPGAELEVPTPAAAPVPRGAAARIEPTLDAAPRDRAEVAQRASSIERVSSVPLTRVEAVPKQGDRNAESRPPDRPVDTSHLDRDAVRAFVRARPVMTLEEEQRARDAWRVGDDREIRRIRDGAAQRVRRDAAAVERATPRELGELARLLREPGTNETRFRFRSALDEIVNRGTEATRNTAKQLPPEEIGRIVGLPRERVTERDEPRSPTFWQGKPGQPRQEQRWLAEMARDGNRFMNRGQLSFVDQGKAIVAYDSSTPAVRAMLDLASVKDWRELRVEGRPEFQRAVYLEARARGIEIRTATWKPSRNDLEPTLARAASPATERAADPTGARTAPLGAERAGRPEPTPRDTEPRGARLLASGTAPYQFKEGNAPSFFVRTEADGKQRVTWGKDLQRALERADARPGDRIELDRIGSQNVRVQDVVRDGPGRGQARNVDAERGQWSVNVVDRGAREAPQTPAQAALEKVLRTGGYSQQVIDQVLKVAKSEEAARTARGERFEVRAFDPAAARTTPEPAIAAIRAQPEQIRAR